MRRSWQAAPTIPARGRRALPYRLELGYSLMFY